MALLTPILLPVLTSVGISPYVVGIVFIVNMGIGMITPPVGNCLYVGCNIAKIKFEQLVKTTIENSHSLTACRISYECIIG